MVQVSSTTSRRTSSSSSKSRKRRSVLDSVSSPLTLTLNSHSSPKVNRRLRTRPKLKGSLGLTTSTSSTSTPPQAFDDRGELIKAFPGQHDPVGNRKSNNHASDSVDRASLYTPLKQDEIRTLLLAPASRAESPLVCEMRVADSTKTHQYEALSYVWGSHATATDNRISSAITCNNVRLRITPSLHTALKHLRYTSSTDTNGSWRRLWVDQLCINQRLPGEVLSQVGRMNHIFSDASRVIVWLDVDESDSATPSINSRETLNKAWRVIRETSAVVGSSLVRSDFLDASSTTSPSAPFSDKFLSVHEYSTTAVPSSTIPSPRTRKKPRNDSKESFSMSTRRQSGTTTNSFNTSLSSLSQTSHPIRTPSSASLSLPRSSLRGSLQTFDTPSTPSYTPTRSVKHKRKHVSEFDPSSMLTMSTSSRSPSLTPKHSTEFNIAHALPLFQHPYFTRKWTFQEIILSKAAVICCGDVEIAWSDLRDWYFHFAARLRPLSSPSLSSSPLSTRVRPDVGASSLWDSLGSFERIIDIRSHLDKWQSRHHLGDAGALEDTPLEGEEIGGNNEQRGIALSELLILTRQRKSLKPEDAVLALLGLHPGFARQLESIRAKKNKRRTRRYRNNTHSSETENSTDVNTKIDEREGEDNLTLPELYLAAFSYCLSTERNLAILSAAGVYTTTSNQTTTTAWPTWLPDWRQSLPIRPQILPRYQNPLSSEHNASGFQSIPIYRLPDLLDSSEGDSGHLRMRVRGFRVGIILQRSGASWPNTFFLPDERARKILDVTKPSSYARGTLDLLTPLLSTSELSTLTLSPLLLRGNPYARRLVCRTLTRSERDREWTTAADNDERRCCEPINTAATSRTGDWVCVLPGGGMLYVLRPISDISTHQRYQNHDDHLYTSIADELSIDDADIEAGQRGEQTAIKVEPARFVGECSVAGLMNGSLVREDDMQEEMQARSGTCSAWVTGRVVPVDFELE